MMHIPLVASAPSSLLIIQSLAGIRVSWTPPTPLGDTTGYMIYYSGGSSGSVDVSGGSTTSHLLTGLSSQTSYNISIMGISDHLPSAMESIEFSKYHLALFVGFLLYAQVILW